MANGGFRPGSGRKPGKLSETTLERIKVENAVKQRIMSKADRLLDARFQLSQGCSYLYRIDQDEKGKKQPAVLVTDPDEIKRYLDEEIDGESYYYVTTEKPDGKSIEDLFNRVFGKPKESVEMSGKLEVVIEKQ